MLDKLIDIILTAQGFKEVSTVAEGYEAMYAAEIAARKAQAGKIADALLAAGVVQEWVSVEDALPGEMETVGLSAVGKQYQGGRRGTIIDGKEYFAGGGGMAYDGSTIYPEQYACPIIGRTPKEE